MGIGTQMATNEIVHDYYFKPENTNQKVVSKMLNESVKKLTGKTSVQDHGMPCSGISITKRSNAEKGYTKGEKIFIKINQTSGRGRLKQAERRKGTSIIRIP